MDQGSTSRVLLNRGRAETLRPFLFAAMTVAKDIAHLRPASPIIAVRRPFLELRHPDVSPERRSSECRNGVPTPRPSSSRRRTDPHSRREAHRRCTAIVDHDSAFRDVGTAAVPRDRDALRVGCRVLIPPQTYDLHRPRSRVPIGLIGAGVAAGNSGEGRSRQGVTLWSRTRHCTTRSATGSAHAGAACANGSYCDVPPGHFRDPAIQPRRARDPP